MTALEAPPDLSTVFDHLSWSGIKTYSTCPKKFSYRYIEQIPEEFKPASLAFGGAFHKASEALHEARIQGTAIPTLPELMAHYEQAWEQETSFASEINYGKEDDATTLKTLAERMLAAYREHVVAEHEVTTGTQIIAIEHAERFRLLADVPPLEMRLDLLELRGTDLLVTDLKTSRSRWNDAKVSESLPQLVLYANGLMPLLRELGATRIVPQFVVVTKAKKPVVQVLQPQASQTDVERLKQQVQDTWTAIKRDVFPTREGWHCSQCSYRGRSLEL